MKSYTWKEAFQHSLEAALVGNATEQNFVGYCYYIGGGVPRDRSIATTWFEKAARNGKAAALFNLALVNDLGEDLRRNPSRAAKLYRRAAERGHLQAQSNLAIMLLEGDGVKLNNAAGLHWLRRAAQRGDAKAQYNLGRAYVKGEFGLSRNIRYARAWLSKAAKHGHYRARRLLRSVKPPLRSG